MTTLYTTKHDVPKRLRDAFPGYKGKKFKVEPYEDGIVALTGRYWDGGSKSSYVLVDFNTGRRTPFADCSPFDSGDFNRRTHQLQPGQVVVEHSVFCGKDMGLTFHIRAEEVQQLIPHSPVDLSDDELIVLDATRSYVSSYNGDSNVRFNEARRYTGITASRWEAAKVSLIRRKLLDKRGAITPAGHNAVGDFRLRCYCKRCEEADAELAEK